MPAWIIGVVVGGSIPCDEFLLPYMFMFISRIVLYAFPGKPASGLVRALRPGQRALRLLKRRATYNSGCAGEMLIRGMTVSTKDKSFLKKNT